MHSYRIQYVLDNLDSPEPLVARTDLVLTAGLPAAERLATRELARYREAVGFRILDNADRVVASHRAL